jgi:hypothetical protein
VLLLYMESMFGWNDRCCNIYIPLSSP